MKTIEGPQRAVSEENQLLCAPDCEEGGRRPAGRAGGCAEAPRAGLPPYGLPSLTRNSRSHRTRQLPSLRKLRRIRVGRFRGQRSGGQIHLRSRQKDGGCSSCQQTSIASTGRKMCTLARHTSGEGPTPLSNGLSLVRLRPSTINPQGVRYASVRPLRLRLRGDRSRPRTRRRLSSGDGPRRKTGAFQCRTISPSLRTTPSTWPAR